MSAEQSTSTKRPYDLHHPFAIICGLALLFALACGLYVLFAPGQDDQPAIGTTAASCSGLPVSDKDGLAGAPQARWASLDGVFIPTHPDHGPAETTDGVRSCYAFSPEGAVYAAANIAAMGVNGNSHQIYEHLTIEGPQRDALMAQTPEREQTQSAGYQIAGFQLVDYDREDGTATVKIAMGLDAAPPYGALTFDLARDGDWKFDPNSSLQVPFEQVPADLTGFYRLAKEG